MAAGGNRIFCVRDGRNVRGPVLYWMSRDQRVNGNHALAYASSEALARQVSLIIAFCLSDNFPGATLRAYHFMLEGLRELAVSCERLRIPFFLLRGDPAKELPRFVNDRDVALLVGDFDPLRVKRAWQKSVAEEVSVPFVEIDAHNIVPCRIISDKQEYSAATFRRKITPLLPKFMGDLPEQEPHPFSYDSDLPRIDWQAIEDSLAIDRTVSALNNPEPGAKAAWRTLRGFIDNGLHRYDAESNDPNANAVSGLSPYLHFGQISAGDVAFAVSEAREAGEDNIAAFLEQLIVRRELSDNFCFYRQDYDSLSAAHPWAKKTLDEHRADPREYIYSPDQFEFADTHDPLWNAAQTSLFKRGFLHGYMRMYWAKKILEWSDSPEAALETAVRLNDRYALDGRDPNGYVGVMWSVAGIHDRAWSERPVFGKVRYMNDKGCRRKFDVDGYIRSAVND